MAESSATNPFQSPYFKPIPNHFNRCGCVSFSCTNCCVTNCFGGKCSGRTCFCIEGHGMFWKRVQHGIYCWTFLSGDFNLTNPQSCCSLYQQLFCLECFWTSSCSESGYIDRPVALSILERKYVPESMGKSIVMLGGCCSLASIYYNCHSMFGHYNRQTLLCMEAEFIATRYVTYKTQQELREEQQPEIVCKLFQGHASIGSLCQSLKSISQFLCLDIRFALPCDQEVPMVCTFFPFCTVLAGGWCNLLCLQSVNELATLSYPDTTRYSHSHGDIGSTSSSGTSSNVGGGTGSGGPGVLPIGSHLVIPVHSSGTGNDTGIQYAEVVGTVQEEEEHSVKKVEGSAPVQYAEAVSVDTRANML